eukprot:Seg2973.1 transcript_id=Seg2973.1/GoldUCD/mRNA.D3Y31 product="hypothetical protein" protein_id=Seg2973.1/GoldUCD/D3Y31
MSSEKKYYRSGGKSNHVNCRACAEKVLSQNYREHLKRKHEGEDHNDLRPKNQGVISFSACANKPNKPGKETEELAAERTTDEISIDDPLSKDKELPPTDQSLTSLSSECIEGVGNYQDSSGNHLMKQILEKIDHLSVGISELKTRRKKPGTKKVTSLCRSIADITNKFVEFVDDEKHSLLICKVCLPSSGENCNIGNHQTPGVFDYSGEKDRYQSDDVECTQKFRNLKRSLKRHLEAQSHLKNLEVASVSEAQQARIERRERLVGHHIGKICYYLFKKGRPDTDFPDLIVLHSMNGLDVGEINHSKVFPAKFLPFVAKEVEGRVTNFLNTRMEQTGFLPAGKVCADKATSKHRTRHFISFITVIPDSESVIQPIFLDVPLVKTHSGPEITNNIIQVLNAFNIIPEQYLGGAYDGQYFHLHVPELLDKHF